MTREDFEKSNPEVVLNQVLPAAYRLNDESVWQKCEDYVIYDFDPSGIAHPSHCLCPCCELEDEEE